MTSARLGYAPSSPISRRSRCWAAGKFSALPMKTARFSAQLLFMLAIAFAARAAEPASEPDRRSVALFNGKDLANWKTEGNAVWEVKDGMIVGRQGPQGASGDLLSEATFENFELSVTFKVQWPANTGVWYRYQTAAKAFQADILEYKDPLALTGSLYCAGKMFLATNRDAKLVRRDDWNTFTVRAVDDHHVIHLNGVKVADVRDDSSAIGRIGFQVHAGSEFADMQVAIKEVTIRTLD